MGDENLFHLEQSAEIKCCYKMNAFVFEMYLIFERIVQKFPKEYDFFLNKSIIFHYCFTLHYNNVLIVYLLLILRIFLNILQL